MNSFNLKSSLEHFLLSDELYQPFITTLKLFTAYANKSIGILRGIANAQSINQSASEFHTRVSNLGSLLPQIKSKKFFDSQRSFTGGIRTLILSWPESSQWLEKIANDVEQFADIYDSYVNSRDPDEAFTILRNVGMLTLEIDDMFLSLNSILDGVRIPEPPQGKSSITIYFPGNLSIADFGNKLHAINRIYDEACTLLNVSVADHPLTIAKLESGSFWVNLVGSAIIMTAITNWIENGAMYIYRTATVEGKIVSISKKAESIETMLGIRQSLVNAKIDTSSIDDHIKKTAVKVASELEILVTEPSIVVNSNVISVQNEILKKMTNEIHYSLPRQIEMSRRELPPPNYD